MRAPGSLSTRAALRADGAECGLHVTEGWAEAGGFTYPPTDMANKGWVRNLNLDLRLHPLPFPRGRPAWWPSV